MNSDKTLLAVFKQLWSCGLAFLYNVPTKDQEIAKIVARIWIFEEHILRSYMAVPGAKNIAYTNLEFVEDLHNNTLTVSYAPPFQGPILEHVFASGSYTNTTRNYSPSGRPRCGRERKAESPEERETRAREMLADLEEQNTALKKENTALRERHAELTAHREENERLAKRSQNVLPSPEMIIHPLDGVRGSAVSVVTLEHSPLASGNGKDTVNIRTHPNKSLPGPLNHSCKSLQRTQTDLEPNSDDLLDYIDLDYWASDMLSMLGQDQKDGIC
ncbi:1057_t:CDS:2 [Paraglomus brasilianum]|uniref:1057_t:CDS:1 n=1 Tax=Paraglomus brasilianum TaxID=144538 RepID=A0A9N9D8F0_9GLOM|nr:1057_t:CDS:2 [Paraglomus brasilianum]